MHIRFREQKGGGTNLEFVTAVTLWLSDDKPSSLASVADTFYHKTSALSPTLTAWCVPRRGPTDTKLGEFYWRRPAFYKRQIGPLNAPTVCLRWDR